jgi:hypothetical protein
MPLVWSKLAPCFLGDIEQPIEDFLEEYKRLTDRYGLTSPQKVETVIQYVDRSQRHIWQHLLGFLNCDWDAFCDELRKEYVTPTPEGQYSRQKLIEFANTYAQKRMGDETDIINYQRQFNVQSKVLLNSGRMTERECNTIFWQGFHPNDQQALHKHLIAMHPSKPTGEAFDLKDIFNVAQAIFSGDDDFLLQEPPTRPKPICTCSSPRNLPAPHIETRTMRFQDDYHKENDKVLEAFIYQLHTLPVQDLKYVLVYARCASRFPNAMLGIPRPRYQVDTTATYAYQAPAPSPLPPQLWSTPAAAPILAPTTPSSSTNATFMFLRFGPCAETCAFCHAEGHRLCSCTTTNEYIQSRRTSWINKWIHLPNGQPVPFDGTRHGLKASIDAWLTLQTTAAPTPAQTTAVLTCDPPLHLGLCNALTS